MMLLLLYLISAPDFIHAGDIYTVNVSFNFSEPTNVTFYEYVFNGSRCVSTGWTANKRTVVVKNATYTICDKIRENTPTGIYKLRVRMIINGSKEDYTKKVAIMGNEDEKIYYSFAFASSIAGLIYIFYRFRKE